MAEDANERGAGRGARRGARVDALVDRALDAMASGRAGEAVPLLREALEVSPGDGAASHALLRALADAGAVEEALGLAREMAAGDAGGDDPLVQTRIAILLQRLGDVPGAEAASARARVLEWKRQLRGPAGGEDV